MASDTSYYSLITPDLDRNLVIQSKYIACSITLSYIMFTKVIGPNIMKNRKPMDLQLTMLLYNSLLVACNAYLSINVTMVAVEMWPYRCSIDDSPIYTETSMAAFDKKLEFVLRKQKKFDQAFKKFYKLASLGLLVKFLELFDTVIFILRKKFRQVSFLHVYHHSIVFTLYWVCLKFRLVGYYVLLTGSINLTIHVALYLYYALSALGPGVRKYLWWKKYLTTLQIMQFFVIMTYMTYSSMTGCDKFNYFDKVVFAGLVTVTALFLNFYMRTYNTTKKSS